MRFRPRLRRARGCQLFGHADKTNTCSEPQADPGLHRHVLLVSLDSSSRKSGRGFQLDHPEFSRKRISGAWQDFVRDGGGRIMLSKSNMDRGFQYRTTVFQFSHLVKYRYHIDSVFYKRDGKCANYDKYFGTNGQPQHSYFVLTP